MTTPAPQQLLAEQGYVPSTHPQVDEIYEVLDQHYATIAQDLADARAQAQRRIFEEMDGWYRQDCPGFATRERRLVGWIDPQTIVRDSKDATFPTHHTREEMARYAAETITSPETHERSSLDLHVQLHSHWRGHVAEITTNGRHRAAIYRATQIPLVQCRITLPRGSRRFMPTTAWTDREDRLMRWLVDQGLITGYVHPDQHPEPHPWGGATYQAPHGSPVPWVLRDQADPLDSIPARLARLENDFGPIDDERFAPLRLDRGLRAIAGPRPGTPRAFVAQALGWPPSPPPDAPPEPPTPCHDPARRSLVHGPKVDVPKKILTALLEPYARHTATFILDHQDDDLLHPGDPFGRVLAWLWTQGEEHEAVEMVLDLYRTLDEQIEQPFWGLLLLYTRLSLDEGWICAQERDELLDALEAHSPEAQTPSRRPGTGA